MRSVIACDHCGICNPPGFSRLYAIRARLQPPGTPGQRTGSQLTVISSCGPIGFARQAASDRVKMVVVVGVRFWDSSCAVLSGKPDGTCARFGPTGPARHLRPLLSRQFHRRWRAGRRVHHRCDQHSRSAGYDLRFPVSRNTPAFPDRLAVGKIDIMPFLCLTPERVGTGLATTALGTYKVHIFMRRQHGQVSRPGGWKHHRARPHHRYANRFRGRRR